VPRADLGLPDTIDETFTLSQGETVHTVGEAHLAACQHSRQVAEAHALDEQFPWHQGRVSLRFVYAHMIAELLRPEKVTAHLIGGPGDWVAWPRIFDRGSFSWPGRRS